MAVKLPTCPNCRQPARFTPSDDGDWPVRLAHEPRGCPYGRVIYHDTEKQAVTLWKQHVAEILAR
jgi:hypothetical protein